MVKVSLFLSLSPHNDTDVSYHHLFLFRVSCCPASLIHGADKTRDHEHLFNLQMLEYFVRKKSHFFSTHHTRTYFVSWEYFNRPDTRCLHQVSVPWYHCCQDWPYNHLSCDFNPHQGWDAHTHKFEIVTRGEIKWRKLREDQWICFLFPLHWIKLKQSMKSNCSLCSLKITINEHMTIIVWHTRLIQWQYFVLSYHSLALSILMYCLINNSSVNQCNCEYFYIDRHRFTRIFFLFFFLPRMILIVTWLHLVSWTVQKRMSGWGRRDKERTQIIKTSEAILCDGTWIRFVFSRKRALEKLLQHFT